MGRRVEGMEVVGKVEALVGRLAAVVGSREGLACWVAVVVRRGDTRGHMAALHGYVAAHVRL